MSSPNDKRLLEEVRDIMRLKHYSIHTERSYCDWIRRMFYQIKFPATRFCSTPQITGLPGSFEWLELSSKVPPGPGPPDPLIS